MPTSLYPRTLPDESSVLGHMLLVCVKNSYYLDWTVKDIKEIFYPALKGNQYRIFYENETAIGFVTWALISDSASEYIIENPAPPRPYEWTSGPRIWVMDFVCNPKFSQKIFTILKRDVFSKEYLVQKSAHTDFVYSFRRDQNNAVRKFVKWRLAS